jgi:hypothetical protein
LFEVSYEKEGYIPAYLVITRNTRSRRIQEERWPVTVKDDWCGEFQPAATPPALLPVPAQDE